MTTNPFKKIFTGMNSSSFSQQFKPFALKMEAQNMPPIVINVFKYYYYLMVSGASGKIPERDISPLSDTELDSYSDLSEYEGPGRNALSETVMIKLNGGLGTSMGLKKAKSLLPAKNGMTFLDIILNQTGALREETGTQIPLLFMNSFNTHSETMMQLVGFDNGPSDLPLAFLQHKYPKVLQKDYSPAAWPQNPELEWNPAGHGDIYTSLVTSGMLDRLLQAGYKYAFISNVDNLGAVMDEKILGYMAENKLPFVMEVADRTPADRKGGHLARLNNGRLVLREIAQCPESDLNSFYDIKRHRFFNTNSIWLDLRVLERVFVYNRMMPLDLIINPKTIDPRNSKSPGVYQLETAMGSAVSAFYDATAVRVPRSRFAPVKTTDDLMAVMSDCYILTDDFRVQSNPKRRRPIPEISLDSRFYKKIDDFQVRFPIDMPSMLECESLRISGDVSFSRDVALKGNVAIENETEHQLVVTPEMLENGGVVRVRPLEKESSREDFQTVGEEEVVA
ncbi:MAG: UTP--glucose-1-phosphate uridylyltransferase [Desulfovibrionales bacterium]